MRPASCSLAALLLPALLAEQEPASVRSPDGRNEVTLAAVDGYVVYSLTRDGRAILLPSRLGFAFRGADSLYHHLRISGTLRDSADITWTQPWGEVARVRDHHNDLAVTIEETRA